MLSQSQLLLYPPSPQAASATGECFYFHRNIWQKHPARHEITAAKV